MDRLTNFLKAVGKWPSMLLALAILIGLNGFLFPWAEKMLSGFGGPDAKVLDLRFGFSPGEANQFLALIGPEGRSFYQMLELTLDLVYPLVYGLFLGALLLLVWRKVLPEKSPWLGLSLLPVATAVFDYLENINIVLLIRRFPDQADTLANLASVFGAAKWVLFGLSVAVLLIGLLFWGIRTLASRK